MKRIRVPEGMLSAAYEVSRVQKQDTTIEEILEAALLWLSEHPQVPTDEQARELIDSMPALTITSAKIILEAWQRRCFVQEEPEEALCSVCNSPIWKVENGMWSHWGGYPDHQASPVPSVPAEIEDLLDTDDAAWMGTGTVKEALIEAYRRGLTHSSVALRKGEQK